MGWRERGDTNSASADGTDLLTWTHSLTSSTLAAEDELRLDGVRERALAEGRTAWTDGAGVDDLH